MTVTKNLTITIDSREPEWIHTLLENYFPDVKFKSETLITGDFKSKHVIVERKTISDLWSSLNDGRFHTQLNRMTTYQNECVVVYIIVGSVDDWAFKMRKMKMKVSEDTIDGAITSLLVRHNIRVICDTHEKAALIRMVKLIAKIENDNILDLPSLRNPDTLMAKYLDISLDTYLSLKHKFGSSMCYLCKLTEKDLISVDGIGKVRAKKIIRILKYGG